MRPNRLPDPEKLPRGTDLHACVLGAELLAGCPIAPRRLRREALLGGLRRHHVLDWHPVREVRLDGSLPSRQWWLEPEFGIVGVHGLPASSYRLDFEVGYKDGFVPVIYAELVVLVARWRAGEVEADEVMAVAGAARAMRAPIEGPREEHRRAT